MLHALNLGGRINEFRHPVLVSPGAEASPGLAFTDEPGAGFWNNTSGGHLYIVKSGSRALSISNGSLLVTVHSGRLQIGGSGLGYGNAFLENEAGSVLAQRDGTNAQTFRLYRTFSDASNYERMAWGYSVGDGAWVLEQQQAGTGANNSPWFIGTRGTGNLSFFTAGSLRWEIANGYLAPCDASQDLGNVGSRYRVRDIYMSRDFRIYVDANAQEMRVKYATELTTIAASPDTDTAIQVPANAIILGVSVRVTVQPGGTSTLDIGVSGDTTRYVTGMSSAATTTAVKARVDAYASATSIRITPNTTPSDAAGRVRVTIHYLDLVAPTS